MLSSLLITFGCYSDGSVGDYPPSQTPKDMSSIPLHLQLRNARRARGLTQTELARQADCTQSAVSMMESGQAAAMARSTLETIARILEVELPAEALAEVAAIPQTPTPVAARICPNADCPGNLPYRVGGEVLFMPHVQRHSGKRCIYCGEVLIGTCPECGAPIHAGAACCAECGTPLVPSTVDLATATDEWLQKRQELSARLLSW